MLDRYDFSTGEGDVGTAEGDPRIAEESAMTDAGGVGDVVIEGKDIEKVREKLGEASTNKMAFPV